MGATVNVESCLRTQQQKNCTHTTTLTRNPEATPETKHLSHNQSQITPKNLMHTTKKNSNLATKKSLRIKTFKHRKNSHTHQKNSLTQKTLIQTHQVSSYSPKYPHIIRHLLIISYQHVCYIIQEQDPFAHVISGWPQDILEM